eukprot:gene2013-2701_t
MDKEEIQDMIEELQKAGVEAQTLKSRIKELEEANHQLKIRCEGTTSEADIAMAAQRVAEEAHAVELDQMEARMVKAMTERKELRERTQRTQCVEMALADLYLEMQDRSGLPPMTEEERLRLRAELQKDSPLVVLGKLRASLRVLKNFKESSEAQLSGARMRSKEKEEEKIKELECTIEKYKNALMDAAKRLGEGEQRAQQAEQLSSECAPCRDWAPAPSSGGKARWIWLVAVSAIHGARAHLVAVSAIHGTRAQLVAVSAIHGTRAQLVAVSAIHGARAQLVTVSVIHGTRAQLVAVSAIHGARAQLVAVSAIHGTRTQLVAVSAIHGARAQLVALSAIHGMRAQLVAVCAIHGARAQLVAVSAIHGARAQLVAVSAIHGARTQLVAVSAIHGTRAQLVAVPAIHGTQAQLVAVSAIHGARAQLVAVSAIHGTRAQLVAVSAIHGTRAQLVAVSAIHGTRAQLVAVSAIHGTRTQLVAVSAIHGTRAQLVAVSAIHGTRTGAHRCTLEESTRMVDDASQDRIELAQQVEATQKELQVTREALQAALVEGKKRDKNVLKVIQLEVEIARLKTQMEKLSVNVVHQAHASNVMGAKAKAAEQKLASTERSLRSKRVDGLQKELEEKDALTKKQEKELGYLRMELKYRSE